jgi:hypothetical protein
MLKKTFNCINQQHEINHDLKFRRKVLTFFRSTSTLGLRGIESSQMSSAGGLEPGPTVLGQTSTKGLNSGGEAVVTASEMLVTGGTSEEAVESEGGVDSLV